jgi:hypothetical protein
MNLKQSFQKQKKIENINYECKQVGMSESSRHQPSQVTKPVGWQSFKQSLI